MPSNKLSLKLRKHDINLEKMGHKSMFSGGGIFSVIGVFRDEDGIV